MADKYYNTYSISVNNMLSEYFDVTVAHYGKKCINITRIEPKYMSITVVFSSAYAKYVFWLYL